MKILITGSRNWTNRKIIEAELIKLPKDTILVHGSAPGADSTAGSVGKYLGFDVRPYPANWKEFGLSAGPQRNQKMLDKEHPDKDGMYINRTYIFHEDPLLGKGTKDMYSRIIIAKPEIEIIKIII